MTNDIKNIRSKGVRWVVASFALSTLAAVSFAPVYADAAAAAPKLTTTTTGKPLPASDPHNSGRWEVQKEFTDEFNGSHLDTTKWNDYNPLWAGRAPSYFDPGNVSVTKGDLQLKVTNSNLVSNPSFEEGLSGWTLNGAQIVTNGVQSRFAVEVGAHGSASQTIENLLPNTEYRLTAQMLKIGAAQGLLRVDGTGRPALSRPVVSTAFGLVYLTFNTGPTSTSARITISNESSDGAIRAMQVATIVPSPAIPDGSYLAASTVKSKEPAGYGYYEVRAKVADASHASAFWLKSDTTEIDIFEINGGSIASPSHQSWMPMNTHYFPDGWATDINTPTNFDAGVRLADDYHRYGVDWEKDSIRFYFDGKLVNTVANTHNDQPQYVLMDTEAFWWQGFPTAETLPSTYSIDYVRAWTH